MKSTPCPGTAITDNYKFSFEKAPRCYAKTRQGSPCKSPAIRGKKRCRMHGGRYSGAPKNNQNALKHGHTTQKAKQNLKEIRDMLKQSQKFISELKMSTRHKESTKY